MKVYLINYQNGNGNVNKQTPEEMEGLEEKMRNLEAETKALKTMVFKIQNSIEANKNWPQLSSLQMN